MKDEKFDVIVEALPRRVTIHNDGYGLELLTMRNGYQSTGCPVDDELIDMMAECIDKYKKFKAEHPIPTPTKER